MNTIHDIARSAFLKLGLIRSQLPIKPDGHAVTSLRMIVYTQQAQIEALERAVRYLGTCIGVDASNGVEKPLLMREPECRHEDEDDEPEPDDSPEA